MNVTVYGASSRKIKQFYIDAVENLCKRLAERGHSLVFGGGATGLMGAAARGFKRGGGKILGIIPEFFKTTHYEVLYRESDSVIWTRDMYERKRLLAEKADAFIIAPGGVGTYDEFFGVLTDKQLHRHVKPIAVYNVNGFYDKLQDFLSFASNEKYINENCFELYKLFSDDDKIIEYIESANATTEKKNYKDL